MLVSLDEARAAFPNIPGVEFPTALNGLEVLNFGPEFSSIGGRLTVLPPLIGPSYMMFVPRPDSDGLDIAGVRTVEIRAPLGTNTGWNLRAPGHREQDICGLNGTYIAFYETMADRVAAGDPRLSLEERYRDHRGFVTAVRRTTRELVREGFLLSEDADKYIQAARDSDVLTGGSPDESAKGEEFTKGPDAPW
jgi:hypothetical protein